MNLRSLLPSAQFAVLAASIALSAGLVFAADYITQKPTSERVQIQTGGVAAENSNWQAALAEVQRESGIALPPLPDENIFEALRSSAAGENLTDTVGRTLLVSLIEANAQGLGSDIPTQERLAAQAAAHLEEGSTKTSLYNAARLTIVGDSATTLHKFGNDVMQTLNDHMDANAGDTLRIRDRLQRCNIFGETSGGRASIPSACRRFVCSPGAPNSLTSVSPNREQLFAHRRHLPRHENYT